jgi:acyl dehydratase
MNLANVIARRFAPVEQRYDWRETALYALALGFGDRPLDDTERRYVVEGPAQLVVPSYCATLAWPPFWHREPELGIDWVHALHREQHFQLHRPLPLQTTVRATHRVAAVEDKGPGRGALVHLDTELHSAASGAHLASLQSVQFLRGDGGCSSHGPARAGLPPLPADTVPSATRDYATLPQAALLYRLASHDLIALHCDPAVAQRAGFERPILHGLNAFGLACRALLDRYAPGTPERMSSMAARFAQPAYPGDTIRVELFDTSEGIRFRARALERDVVILDRGTCRFMAA